MINQKLDKEMRYRIFLRAVVDKHLYTSSPFSDYLSLDMRAAPEGELPQRPNPNQSPSDLSPVQVSDPEEFSLLLLVLPAAQPHPRCPVAGLCLKVSVDATTLPTTSPFWPKQKQKQQENKRIHRATAAQ